LKEKEEKYVDYLEKKGYMVFKNIKELKQIVLETMEYQELFKELTKRHLDNECGCSE